MFLSLLSIIIPVIVSATVTLFGFHPFYEQSPVFTAVICIISGIITLFCILPLKSIHRAFFLLMGTIAVTNGMYNLIFSITAFILAFIIAFFLPRPLAKKRILFTKDSALVTITYHPLSRIRSYFIRVSMAWLVTSLLLFVLTFSFSTPNAIWNVRAFPVNLTEKPSFEYNAVPSGMVTCTVSYDNAAIYIDSFSAIETERGTVPSPAESAGMKQGDVVVKINGQRAKQSDFIKNGPDGSMAKFEVLRMGEDGVFNELILEITPVYSVPDGKYMIGIYYYDSTLPGIYQTVQTVSFSYPDTGYFAATAHASEMTPPDDYVQILKTAKLLGRDELGLTATPGETVGEILHANRFGAFGKWDKTEGEALPIAQKSELTLGKATILSSFAGGIVKEYEVYVTGTYRIDQRDVICLIVTDDRIRASGGVTRGMSGSPVIQHGKIIGALSNTDSDGYCAYATFASDMAHELYLAKDILK